MLGVGVTAPGKPRRKFPFVHLSREPKIVFFFSLLFLFCDMLRAARNVHQAEKQVQYLIFSKITNGVALGVHENYEI